MILLVLVIIIIRPDLAFLSRGLVWNTRTKSISINYSSPKERKQTETFSRHSISPWSTWVSNEESLTKNIYLCPFYTKGLETLPNLGHHYYAGEVKWRRESLREEGGVELEMEMKNFTRNQSLVFFEKDAQCFLGSVSLLVLIQQSFSVCSLCRRKRLTLRCRAS